MVKFGLLLVIAAVAGAAVLYSTVYAAPPSAPDLTGKHVAILTTEGFHDRETSVPMEYVLRGGGTVTLIGPATGEVRAYNSDTTVTIERTVAEVKVDEFDALIIPGGRAPRALREHEAVLDFVRAFMETGKPVAAICHGPQVLAAAGVLEGRELTGYSGIEGEIAGAGATFVEANIAVPFATREGNLVTARLPHDLRPFCRRLGQALTE